MNFHEFYIMAREHGSVLFGIVVVLMTLVQISPIKIDPWSKVGKWLKKIIFGDVTDKLDNLDKKIANMEQKLDDHIRESDERDLRKRRESILDFASAIAADKRRYSKEQYEQMLKECDEYLMYCDKKGFRNAVAERRLIKIGGILLCQTKLMTYLSTSL